jgi:hypothetical protein
VLKLVGPWFWHFLGMRVLDARIQPDGSEVADAVIGWNIFCVDGRFDKFNISPLSLKAIHEVMGFTTMTVVQDATLPAILKGLSPCSHHWLTCERLIYQCRALQYSFLLLKNLGFLEQVKMCLQRPKLGLARLLLSW